MSGVDADSGVTAIGSADVVMGLGLLGIAGVAVTDATEARAALADALTRAGTVLVLVDEAWVGALEGTLERSAREASGPLVVEIPSPTGSDAAEALHRRVERALGFTLQE